MSENLPGVVFQFASIVIIVVILVVVAYVWLFQPLGRMKR
ncbi:hypothetical protein SAMN04487947_0449 [Halogeometricum rufum]|uniref:Uncharacterized protein n=1 Tax=Halogeometricum rufum TaxID=553469 RepID=A0A1I6G2H5_9EURY|nr:hypothetical protein SAMN04487947_0449 [Halogeometricum rufum]